MLFRSAQQGGLLEPSVDEVWPGYNLDKIAISEGAFKHERLDGHLNCACCDIARGGISDFCVLSCCENNITKPGKVFEESAESDERRSETKGGYRKGHCENASVGFGR